MGHTRSLDSSSHVGLRDSVFTSSVLDIAFQPIEKTCSDSLVLTRIAALVLARIAEQVSCRVPSSGLRGCMLGSTHLDL